MKIKCFNSDAVVRRGLKEKVRFIHYKERFSFGFALVLVIFGIYFSEIWLLIVVEKLLLGFFWSVGHFF